MNPAASRLLTRTYASAAASSASAAVKSSFSSTSRRSLASSSNLLAQGIKSSTRLGVCMQTLPGTAHNVTNGQRGRNLSTSQTRKSQRAVDGDKSGAAVEYHISPTLSSQEYHAASDHAMESLTEYLEDLVESSGNSNFDIEYSAGVLTLKVSDDAIYVINKQPPNRQIWLSSPISGPKRYDYSVENGVWFYHRDHSTMKDLLNTELRVLMKNEDVNVNLGEGDQ